MIRTGCQFKQFWVVISVLVALVARAPNLRAGDLPPLNAKVAAFAWDRRGTAVGDGVCITLAVEALRDSGARQFPLDDPAGEYVWGQPVVDLRTVLPGDILQFRNAVFKGSRPDGRNRRITWTETYPHHTAIVVRTAENGRLVTICHQNVAIAGEDQSRVGLVREAVLRMNSLQPGGNVRAYRPLPHSEPVAEDPIGADHARCEIKAR